MESEDRLYSSLIVTFLGFLIFISSVLSKKIAFLSIISEYFVLVLFSGAIISVIGLILVLIWHVDNRRPYYEDKGLDFSNFLGAGIFLVLFSVFMVSYFKLDSFIYYGTLSSSILGIVFLFIGLKYYITDAFKFRKKNPAHS